jgi:hypothetical protein
MYMEATDPNGRCHIAYLNGVKVERCAAAKAGDPGYVIVYDQIKGSYDPHFHGVVRKRKGRVELVNTETGVVIR